MLRGKATVIPAVRNIMQIKTINEGSLSPSGAGSMKRVLAEPSGGLVTEGGFLYNPQ